MFVKDIMVTKVYTIEPESAIKDAAKLMSEYNIGSLIVVDKGALAGMITERDIIRKVVAKDLDVDETTVKEIMRKEVYYVTSDTDVDKAVDLMVEKKIKKLPVVDKNSLVGIITLTDVCSIEPKMVEKVAKLFSISKEESRAAS